MPNSLFQTLLDKATQPIVNTDKLHQPGIYDNPAAARAQSFGASMLDGLGINSPAGVAGVVLPFLRPLRALTQRTLGASKSPDLLVDMVKSTQTGPVGPKLPSYKPTNRWELGHQPKTGGVLEEVLSRAAEKQGAGQALTPGESSLLNQFMNYPRPR